jgi:hypothetical protein
MEILFVIAKTIRAFSHAGKNYGETPKVVFFWGTENECEKEAGRLRKAREKLVEKKDPFGFDLNERSIANTVYDVRPSRTQPS